MKKITVIGGGGTGIMMAADLTMKGHDVTLFEMYEHANKRERLCGSCWKCDQWKGSH